MNRTPLFLQPGDTPPTPTRGVLVEGTTVEAPAAGGSQWRARATYVDTLGERHPLTVYGPDRETAQSRLTTRIAELDREN